jgi:O-antigen ligase
MNSSKLLNGLLYLWFVVFFISVACCFRAISSISIGLIIATGLFKNKIDTGSWLNFHVKSWFLAACCLFYLVQVAAMLYTANFHEGIKDLQTKTALLFVPFSVCCSNYLNGQAREKLMKVYIWILAAVLFYCLLLASYKYCFTAVQGSVFFYHDLVSPFRQHAVQVSILLFMGLIYLLDKASKGTYVHTRPVHFLLIFYFTSCLLLLSSKLVIAFSACSLLYYLFPLLKANRKNRFAIFISLFAALLMIALVLLTPNRISQRFNEITSGNLTLVEQQDFTPAVYFNGLQFRLLQWRFVKEILTDRHAWLTGVSDNAQALLNNKYTSTHMYTGGFHSATPGYLGLNTHNQFLQSLLQSGVPGLLAFILICCGMIRLVLQRQNRELTILVLLLIAYCFNEAVLETQYGIILFTFFPLFLYYGSDGKYPADSIQYVDSR